MPRRHRCLALVAGVLMGAGLLAAPAGAAPRVAALTPFSANTLAYLGVRPVVIGQTVGQTQYSTRLSGVPVLRLSHPFGPNLEQLAQRNPRLVLTAPAWTRGSAGMRKLGMRVREFEPRSVSQAARDMRNIGALVGRAAGGRMLANWLNKSVRQASRGIRRRPSVLLILGVGRTPYAYLANSWGGDLVRRSGGRLLTGGLRAPGGYARISNEFVVARNPDYIIAVPHGNPGDLARMKRYLQRNPTWRSTKAARRGHIYVSTSAGLLQPTVNPALTILGLRRVLGT